LLRIARRFASEGDPNQVLGYLLDEAVPLIGGTFGVVSNWDPQRRECVTVKSSFPVALPGSIPAGEGAIGRAANERALVILNDYPDQVPPRVASRVPGVTAAIGVPVQHEGRMRGGLGVSGTQAAKHCAARDGELLALIASFAAAALVGLARARLLTVTLTARELAHRLNNDLSLPVGMVELLLQDPTLPARARGRLEQTAVGLEAAVQHISQLQQLVRFETKETPLGTSLDLDRSIRSEHKPPAAET
jgi:GAF domain-containing protein